MKNKFPAALFVVQLLLLADVAVSAVLLHKYNDWLGVVCLVPAVLLIILGLIVYAVFTKNSFRHISKMNKHLENSAAEYMNTLPAPVAVIDENKNFVWFNQIFTEKISLGQDVYGLDFEGFVSIDINNLLSEGFAVCHINGCIYKISAEKYDKMNMSFHVLYFQDQTDYYTVKKKSDDSHQNVVIITIDNYDEIMQNAKESVKSQTSLETEKIIENLKNVCFEYVHQILSKTDVLKLMELIRSQDPTLVNDLIPVFLSPIDLKNILANLLRESIGKITATSPVGNF